MVEQADKVSSKGRGNLTLVLLVLILVSIIGIGSALFLFTPWSGSEQAEKKSTAKLDEDQMMTTEIIELEPFIVNLASENMDHYLKVIMVIQLSSKEAIIEVTNKKPQLKDSIITALSSMSPPEALSLQGRHQLKAEIINRINTIIKRGVAREIFFTEYVVQ
ncbi:MAG: flagellar basal body-associated FliL family protein [Nitrospinota bacterium]